MIVETMGKCRHVKKNQFRKKYTNPTSEYLLYTVTIEKCKKRFEKKTFGNDSKIKNLKRFQNKHMEKISILHLFFQIFIIFIFENYKINTWKRFENKHLEKIRK